MRSTPTKAIVVDNEEQEEALEEEDDDLPEFKNNRPIPRVKYRGIVKVEKLFPPSSGFSTGRNWPEKIRVATDPMILNTVHLVDYKRELENIIHQKKNLVVHLLKKVTFPFPELPKMPEINARVIKRMRAEDLVKLEIQRPLLSELFAADKKIAQSDFVRGIGIRPPPVPRMTASRILKKSVIALCGHVGFRSITETAVLTLTDIAGYYMTQFCKVLRANVDRSEGMKEIGHIDALEQTFQDVEGTSMLDLVQFYQERVIKYHSNVIFECRKLQKMYKDIEAAGARKVKERAERKKLPKTLAEKECYIEDPTESAGMKKKDLSGEGKSCVGMKSQEQSPNIEKSGAMVGSPSQDTTGKEIDSNKKPKPSLQTMKDQTKKSSGNQSYLENYDTSELFPDRLSLTTDDSSSFSSSSSEAIEAVVKSTRKRKKMTKPDSNRNRGTAKGSNKFKAPASPAVKSKQITPGAKRQKKSESGKDKSFPKAKKSSATREKKIGPSQTTKDIPGSSQQVETLVKEMPAPSVAVDASVSAENLSQIMKTGIPETAPEGTLDTLVGKQKTCQRISNAPDLFHPDENLVCQRRPFSLTVEKLIGTENMSPASSLKEKPMMQPLKKRILEKGKGKACGPPMRPGAAIENIGSQLMADILSQSSAKTKMVPAVSKSEEGSKRQVPVNARDPAECVQGMILEEVFPMPQDNPSFQKQLLEEKKRQMTSKKAPSPAGSVFVPGEESVAAATMHQPSDMPMDLSTMYNMMEVPSPLSPIGEAGKRKRKYKKTRV